MFFAVPEDKSKLYFFQFPFDEPPGDEVGEPSHRKENLNRNPRHFPADQHGSITSLSDEPDEPEFSNPSNHEYMETATKGTDFTELISSNNDANRPAVEFLYGDSRKSEEIRADTVYRNKDYMNTQETTQRIKPDLFVTPRNPFTFKPTPSRRWIPYSQSTSLPRRIAPQFDGVFRTTEMDKNVNGGITRRNNANHNIRGYDVTTQSHDGDVRNDDVRTGLRGTDRTG